MMADYDFSWIDTWGMDPSDASYYSQNWNSDAIDWSSIGDNQLSALNPNTPYTPGADIGGINWGSLGSAIGGLLNGTQLNSALSGALTGKGNLGTLLGALGAGYGVSNQIDWQQLLGQGRDLAGKTGGLISGYTPYTGERVAGLDPSQQQAIGYAPGMVSQGQQMMSSAGVYDPNKVQDYLNPYVEGGLAAANRLTTQNLMENTLPGVNSTFTGQGQFGSTRNADFTNRAIRDNQQGIANSNAANMVSAYGNAQQNYMNQLQNQGTMGQNLMGQGLALGGLAQGQQQKQLDAGLAAWNQNRTLPLDMFKTWAGSVGQFNPAGASGTSDVSSALAKLIGG